MYAFMHVLIVCVCVSVLQQTVCLYVYSEFLNTIGVWCANKKCLNFHGVTFEETQEKGATGRGKKRERDSTHYSESEETKTDGEEKKKENI